MRKKIIHITSSQSPHAFTLTNSLLSNDYCEIDHRLIVYGQISEQKKGEILQLTDKTDAVSFCNGIMSLIYTLLKIRSRIVVCHGDSYLCRLIPSLLFCRVVWVCWGAYTTLSGSLLSYISYPFKYCLNNSLHLVIALMMSDRDDLIKTYHLSNVILLPYPGTKNKQYFPPSLLDTDGHTQLRVLIGNSGHCAPWYKDVLQSISRFKDENIEVHCMFQYPSFPKQLSELNAVGTQYLGGKFYIDTEYMDKSEYYKYISSFDVYICPKPSQSGLGAIHIALLLGKKVYLTGKNLKWEQYIGAKVFEIESLYLGTYSDLCRSLSDKDKEYNREKIIQLWNNVGEWDKLYKSL